MLKLCELGVGCVADLKLLKPEVFFGLFESEQDLVRARLAWQDLQPSYYQQPSNIHYVESQRHHQCVENGNLTGGTRLSPFAVLQNTLRLK